MFLRCVVSCVWRCLSLCVCCPSVVLSVVSWLWASVVSRVPVYLCLSVVSVVFRCVVLCCCVLLHVVVCVVGRGGSVCIERVFPCVLAPRPHVRGTFECAHVVFFSVSRHTPHRTHTLHDHHSHRHSHNDTTTATQQSQRQRQRRTNLQLHLLQRGKTHQVQTQQGLTDSSFLML